MRYRYGPRVRGLETFRNLSASWSPFFIVLGGKQMAEKKTTHQTDLTKILSDITNIEIEIKELLRTGPSREERIAAFNQHVDRHANDGEHSSNFLFQPV